MNKWRVFGYTILTWLGLSVLAAAFTLAMQQQTPEYNLIAGQSVVWSWASLIMGGVVAGIRKRWQELLWGILFFFLCLLPLVGVMIGVGYFGWIYTKMEKDKSQKKKAPYTGQDDEA